MSSALEGDYGPIAPAAGGGAAWGGITGTLSNQTDLQTALDAKLDYRTVADSTARLALTGLSRGARVFQDDTDFWYELINPAAPSDAASWQGIPKVYRANLTQASTDPPTATVLENSLGGTVVWTRDSAGLYTGTLAGAFLATKTHILTQVKAAEEGIFNELWRSTDDTLAVITAGDDFLANWSVQVLVYP